MQANLLLTTLFQHCADIEQESDIFVLHRNDESHEQSYEILQSEFPTVNFVKETSFKQDLLKILDFHESNISFVLFLVDDQIFTEDFSMKEVVSTLVENDDCIGFSLRLGKNCVKCFPYNCEQNLPEFYDVKNNIKKFNWQKAEYDFSYPLEISASCYRVEDIKEILENCDYHNPNTYESIFSSCYFEDKPNLLCYEKGVSFSNPINKTQQYNNNRSGDIDPNLLNEKYLEGYRIDEEEFYKYQNDGAHELVGIMLKKERDIDE